MNRWTEFPYYVEAQSIFILFGEFFIYFRGMLF